jgi:hypothetical protein
MMGFGQLGKADYMDYERLERRLESAGVDIGLAEMHGRVAAVVCTVPDLKQSRRLQLALDWLAVDGIEQDILASLDEVFVQTAESLHEFSDFDFRLLLPGDDHALSDRFLALTCWCSGFLSQLGESELAGALLSHEEIEEILVDFQRIAAMSDDIQDAEENETDMIEIYEYIRVGVLMVQAISLELLQP